MEIINKKEWEDVSKQLDIILDKIFEGEDWRKNTNSYEKRSQVYNYLTSKVNHDNYLFNKIEKNKKDRNISKELFSVLESNLGVSNGIAQAYKLLLEKLGIYSMVVISPVVYGKENIGSLIKLLEKPNDMKSVKKFLKDTENRGIQVQNHMFNLVKNVDNTFSFDDLTFAILNKENKNKFFNYDIIKAYEFGQNKIKGMPSIIMNINIGKMETMVDERVLESKLDDSNFVPLPKNICIGS